MFKFIHAADIHLDSPFGKLDLYEGVPVDDFRGATRRAFENLVQLAISEEVSFLLISGDLYDGDWQDYNTGLYLVSQIAKLRDAGIEVFIVAGNHDAASKITRTLRLPSNVKLFSNDKPATFHIEKLDVAIHGQSFPRPAVKKDLSKGYPLALNGYFNIGLLHTCVTGREGHEPYAPCSLDGLSSKGYDYWALGHVHNHEVLCNNPLILFSGNTQGRHARETGPKGCVLVTVIDNKQPKIEFKPVDVLRWEIISVDAQEADSGYEIVDRFNGQLEGLLNENPGMSLAVRVKISGETPAFDDILSDLERWTNEIRSVSLEKGDDKIWIEKVEFRLAKPISYKSLEKREGALGELLNLFDELKTDADAIKELAFELKDLEKKLPKELKYGLKEIDSKGPHFIGDLLKQVKPMLTKSLLQKRDRVK